MQFSQKSKENMDSCRFCWMCRHICPIGNATGLERNTSRARALGLSLVARDAIEYSDDVVANVYECSLCGACVKECVTGWDPVLFTKEARLIAALDGKLPEYIGKMVDDIETNGTIYSGEKDSKLTAEIGKLGDADTLLFIGEDALYNCPDKALAAIELLKKSGVDFTVLENEPNSGASMDFLVSAAAETKQLMEKCAKALSGFKKVVCYDPADAKVFLREYKEWDIKLSPEVITFTSFVDGLIEDKKLAVKKSKLSFTPQDPHQLSRDLEETEPFRNILSKLGNVTEMLLNRKDTMLAGNLIMNQYMPEVMEKVATDRWNNALNMNTKILVTASPAEYVMLSKTKPEGAELMTLEEAVIKCL